MSFGDTSRGFSEAVPDGNELRHLAQQHPATGTEVRSRRRAVAEVPAVVAVASGIVEGLPSRAQLGLDVLDLFLIHWPLLKR